MSLEFQNVLFGNDNVWVLSYNVGCETPFEEVLAGGSKMMKLDAGQGTQLGIGRTRELPSLGWNVRGFLESYETLKLLVVCKKSCPIM